MASNPTSFPYLFSPELSLNLRRDLQPNDSHVTPSFRCSAQSYLGVLLRHTTFPPNSSSSDNHRTMPDAKLQLAVAALGIVLLQQFVSRRRRQSDQKEKVQQAKKEQQERTAGSAAADEEAFVVEIEYCTGCRWMLRAAWMAQELLTTFQTDEDSRLRSIMLTPNPRQGGVFNVYLREVGPNADPEAEPEVLWSRKIARRFPESKELKQIVRDYVNPERGLGHSDKK
ncbi:unnamed protein product [Phytophthora fragariaefolia]|uniref:Unnamed protein product n=1 Tax=Phytophthora fragariaefolia TaxID=1490495 RepID=A0A9W7CZ22_9STRA|nr:unnamed protein product [Phytophthora fragariaefolia]